ncbi:hypothetical protein MVEG_06693 [Podila verticillata NRRL 6337]|nr:hypothetical protein MVEG_06693 [Podila verticillata NRRL 6337]
MERLKGEGVQEWLKQHFTSPWHGHQTVASELSSEIISNIQERCSQLDASVRLGVLFSLISLKKAQQVQLRDKCQAFIDHGCTDADEWVRLVSQMLRDYPTNGTLRFNIEQFADQGALSAPLAELQKHIATDGFKFHPKEYAYLNDTVCRVSQGKDPKAKEYPPVTGPSLQQHFNLRDSSTVDKERGERLRKLAEQSSPILPMSSSIAPPTGQPLASGAVAPGTSSAVTGSTGSAPSAPIPGGPPRPPAKSSSGLFVKKPAGSFLRNNAPRPMPLPRNPSVGSLPLRSPRIDTPMATPRLNQKSSRIQILDIQQGTEIMQTMNAEKLRKEQADQREKELKKEQRLQEQELKRQQDAEKKAQLAREKEEKKKEREDAKKAKERQKHEREEQYQQQQREREKEKEERDREQREPGDHSNNNNNQNRSLPDDDDDEGSLSSTPARKKSRPNSSRDEDEDYDDQAGPSAALSPVTPLAHSYSHHGIDDRPTPMDATYAHPADSYFPPHAQHDQHAPPVSDAARDHPTLFQDTNLLTPVDRAYIIAFLEGHPVLRPNMNDKVYQIVMNQEQVQDATGRTVYELILIEMNFETGEWRKIKRKRNKPHNPAMT